jgi:hypothetical protein
MKYYIVNVTDTSVNKTPSIILVKDNINYSIPFDEANNDYQEYLAWVAEGNVAEEWKPNGN